MTQPLLKEVLKEVVTKGLKKEVATDQKMLSGQVVKIEPAAIRVRVDQRTLPVQPAASCLLQAQLGDQVLLAGDNQRYWLLAILQRDPQQVAQLQVPGGLTIATAGHLTLHSAQDLQISSARAQRLISREWTLESQSVEVRCQRANVLTRVLRLTAGTLSQWAEQIEQVAGRLLQRFDQRICTVVEHDEQRSGTHRHLVKGSTTLHAESVTHKARGHVTIDGQQIHLG